MNFLITGRWCTSMLCIDKILS